MARPPVVTFPTCADWTCDDEVDWEAAAPGDPEYRGAKREEQLVRYHQPRHQWRERLQRERDERNGGRPLWARA